MSQTGYCIVEYKVSACTVVVSDLLDNEMLVKVDDKDYIIAKEDFYEDKDKCEKALDTTVTSIMEKFLDKIQNKNDLLGMLLTHELLNNNNPIESATLLAAASAYFDVDAQKLVEDYNTKNSKKIRKSKIKTEDETAVPTTANICSDVLVDI